MKYETPAISTGCVAQLAIQDSNEKPGALVMDSSSTSEYIATVNAYAADE